RRPARTAHAGVHRRSLGARSSASARMARPMSRACALIAALAFTALALPVIAFDLQGHRGARGLRPENTRSAFTFALATGVTTLETDLAVTRDGEIRLQRG